jgi:alpha-tubulin suppressor-like RCC1 family protein
LTCWGVTDQIGPEKLEFSPTPKPVALSDVVSVSSGYSHTCALVGSGEVKCWGFNDDGQLGDGSTAASFAPVTVKFR